MLLSVNSSAGTQSATVDVRVLHLSLTDFRNYESADLDLVPGPNVFVGQNGQGKTNLVEAVGYLSTLGSHRVSNDHALIRVGQDAAIVRASVDHSGRVSLVELQINRSRANRAQLNRAAIRPRELPRHFSSVLFAPEDLALIRGEPSGRRRFLDELLVQRSPRMAGVLSDYERVVKQRNSLLKDARGPGRRAPETLDLWDERLVEYGAQLIDARGGLIAELLPDVSRAYTEIAGEDHNATLTAQLTVEFEQPTDSTHTAFRGSLAKARRAELDRGMTLVGPHRDDLVLGLNGLPARGYASHGESWSFALSLRLAAAQVLRRESSSGDPVLILDDVFAELDASRRERLAAAVASFEQVLITAAVLEDVPPDLATTVVRIRAGQVVTEGGQEVGGA